MGRFDRNSIVVAENYGGYFMVIREKNAHLSRAGLRVLG